MTVPDDGTARVGGLDVVTEARSVRRHIGVTGQDATLDELLSGRQNLVHGRRAWAACAAPRPGCGRPSCSSGSS